MKSATTIGLKSLITSTLCIFGIRETTLLFIPWRIQLCIKNCWTTLQTSLLIVSQHEWYKTPSKPPKPEALFEFNWNCKPNLIFIWKFDKHNVLFHRDHIKDVFANKILHTIRRTRKRIRVRIKRFVKNMNMIPYNLRVFRKGVTTLSLLIWWLFFMTSVPSQK